MFVNPFTCTTPFIDYWYDHADSPSPPSDADVERVLSAEVYEEMRYMTDIAGRYGLIPLNEWAAREGITPRWARKLAQGGKLNTAVKIGRNWLISEEETYTRERN